MPGRVGLAFWFLFVLALIIPNTVAAATDSEPVRPQRGLYYTNHIDRMGPWSIHVVRIDRSHPELRFSTTLGDGEILGMSRLSDQIRRFPRQFGQPLAAVNGDFYEKAKDHAGRPRDLQIREGEVVSHPAGHTCFWIDAHGNPHMTNVFSRFRVLWPDGRTVPFLLNAPRPNDTAVLYTAIGSSNRTHGGLEYVLAPAQNTQWPPLRIGQTCRTQVREVRYTGETLLDRESLVLSIGPNLGSRLPVLSAGAVVEIVTETVPDLAGAEVAIGGGPALIMGGKLMSWKDFLMMRHPRSAFGWNKEYFYLVEVDGRQIDLSVGMTFQELAEFMLKLGCDYAMNFDGGGSAALWCLGEIRSSPSEGRERPAPNALVVLKKDRGPK